MDTGSSAPSTDVDDFDDLLARVAAAPAVEDAWSLRALPVGTIVGERYRIEGVLGRGGTAVVYRARSRELRRVVAIKILSVGADRERLRRLRSEASTMARLNHPNVLAVMDVGMHDGQLFLVIEHVDGGTLRQWLDDGPRPLASVLDRFVQAGEGLAAAHRLGVVHRDFKPDNALVGRDGRVRVSDFGLARGFEAGSEAPSHPASHPASRESGQTLDAPLTATGLVHGTPAYMAPEQLDGRGADAKSDQFAFCVALWEALHGQRPFAARTLEELRQVTREGRIDPSPRSVAIPRRIRRVLERGLRPAANDRFPSMDALLQALRRAARPRVPTLAIAACIAIAGVGLAAIDRTAAGPDCAASDLAGVWDAPTRQAAAHAFEIVGSGAAAATWPRVRDTVDTYASAWSQARRHACEVVQTTGGPNEDDLDLRLSCLQRRRDDIVAIAGVLTRADAGVVHNAVDLVGRLAPVAACDDLAALRRGRVPPADPRIAARVDELRARLAVATASAAAGRMPAGIAIAEEVADAARGLGYAPLQADALLVLGTTASKQGRHEPANDAMREAYFVATSAQYDRAALRAALGLTGRVTRSGADLEEALRWYEIAAALARRVDADAEVHAELEGARAEAYYTQARGPEAIAGFRRALELLEDAPESTIQVPVRTTLANVLLLERRFEECVEVASGSVAIATKMYGELHTSTAMALGTLAECRAHAGDAAAAEAPARRAVEILEAAQGRRSMNVADAYDALRGVLLQQGKIDEAIDANRRVQEIQDAVNPHDTYNRAATLANHAILEAKRGRATEAEAAIREAMAIADEDTPAHAQLRPALEDVLEQILSAGDDRTAGDDG